MMLGWEPGFGRFHQFATAWDLKGSCAVNEDREGSFDKLSSPPSQFTSAVAQA